MLNGTTQPGEKRRAVTVPESAELLGISRAAAYRAVRAGHIPSIRLGRTIRVPIAALEQMFARADVSGLRVVAEAESRTV
jgi:excisionase family DNA binding protein